MPDTHSPPPPPQYSRVSWDTPAVVGGWQPIHLATYNSHVELTRWLCAQPTGEAGSLFGVCADFGWEPLHAAAAGDKRTS